MKNWMESKTFPAYIITTGSMNSRYSPFEGTAVISVDSAGKVSFVQGCTQRRLMSQRNGKWPIFLAHASNPLIIAIAFAPDFHTNPAYKPESNQRFAQASFLTISCCDVLLGVSHSASHLDQTLDSTQRNGKLNDFHILIKKKMGICQHLAVCNI